MNTWEEFNNGLMRTLFELPPGHYVIIEPSVAPDTGWVQFRTAHDLPNILFQCRANDDQDTPDVDRTPAGWILDGPHWNRYLTWPALSTSYMHHAQALTKILQENADTPGQLTYTAWRDAFTEPKTKRWITTHDELVVTLPHLNINHNTTLPTA